MTFLQYLPTSFYKSHVALRLTKNKCHLNDWLVNKNCKYVQ
jgi:hypothetical protein